MLKLKVDENLPVEATAILASAGHDVLTVLDQKLGGQHDANIASICRNECRAIVTLDLDFANIQLYPPSDYSGIVVLRLARLDKHSLLGALSRLAPLLNQEPLNGKLWIVNETRVRIRG